MESKHCGFLNAPLYGCGPAGSLWNAEINDYLVDDLKYSRDHADPCLYTKWVDDQGNVVRPANDPLVELAVTGDRRRAAICDMACKSPFQGLHLVMIILYVDDGRMKNDPSEPARTAARADQTALSKRFKLKFKLGGLFIGLNVDRSSTKRVTISAWSNIRQCVKRYLTEPLESYPAQWSYTPGDDTLANAVDAATQLRSECSDSLLKNYKSIVGALSYIALACRPDVCAHVARLCRCLTCPTDETLAKATRVLVYLGRTEKLGITYDKDAAGGSVLSAKGDSDWSVRKSTAGHSVLLAGATVGYGSRREKCIALSSTEAELMALTEVAIEVIHFMMLCSAMGMYFTVPVVVDTDNKGAYDLCHRESTGAHSRHVNRRVYKARELRAMRVIKPRLVPTDDNVADMFTKMLDRGKFTKFRNEVMNIMGKITDEYTHYVARKKKRADATSRGGVEL